LITRYPEISIGQISETIVIEPNRSLLLRDRITT
jgi:hypothetical protein